MPLINERHRPLVSTYMVNYTDRRMILCLITRCYGDGRGLHQPERARNPAKLYAARREGQHTECQTEYTSTHSLPRQQTNKHPTQQLVGCMTTEKKTTCKKRILNGDNNDIRKQGHETTTITAAAAFAGTCTYLLWDSRPVKTRVRACV